MAAVMIAMVRSMASRIVEACRGELGGVAGCGLRGWRQGERGAGVLGVCVRGAGGESPAPVFSLGPLDARAERHRGGDANQRRGHHSPSLSLLIIDFFVVGVLGAIGITSRLSSLIALLAIAYSHFFTIFISGPIRLQGVWSPWGLWSHGLWSQRSSESRLWTR